MPEVFSKQFLADEGIHNVVFISQSRLILFLSLPGHKKYIATNNNQQQIIRSEAIRSHVLLMYKLKNAVNV